MGGAGFIGSHLIRQLVTAGVHVTSIDRDPRGRLTGSGAESIQSEIAAGESKLIEFLTSSELDAVFIAAGTGLVPRSLEYPQADLESNVRPSLVVLEALRRSARLPIVVYLSSVAVYGEARELPMTERHATDPLSPYGVSKLAAERYLRLYHTLYGFPGLSLRLFSVYGAGQLKLVVHDLLARLVAKEAPLVVRGAPHVTRDYVSVRDVARCAHHLAAVAPARGEAYNICSGVGTTLESLVDQLRAVSRSTATVDFTGGVRAGDPVQLVGDPSAAAALGAYCDPDMTGGLEEMVAWLSRGSA